MRSLTALITICGRSGERGVDRVLEWFRADLVRTMSLVGAATVADLDRSLIELPERFPPAGV